MQSKVKRYVEKWHMLTSEDCVIVGVSGGADSICLLLLLIELQKELGFKLVAAHLNHGLRGEEADEDEAYVRRFCAERNILYESSLVNVELIAKNRKQSTEEAGRDARSEFFNQLLEKYRGTKIALAHHQNDSAETFLLNLARGSGMKGLGGISPVNGNVIRPLLCVEREEIESYLLEQGISYCVDKTNETDEYTRNRIRNHVLPYMKEEVNSKLIEHMNETMGQMRQVQDYLEQQMQVFWEQCVEKTEHGYVVMEEAYQNVPDVIKPMLLKKVLADLSGREKDLEAVHVKLLQELFEKQTGRKVDLPYQMEGKRIYRGIGVCLKAEKEEAEEEIIFHLQDENAVFCRGKQKISCKVFDRPLVNHNSLEKNDTRWFNCDIIKDSISFRTRRQGDYITIHPDGRTQKLKAYFVNEKIPQEERDKILLVADGSHILWIVGYRHNCLHQIKPDTKHILEIRISEGENYGRDN